MLALGCCACPPKKNWLSCRPTEEIRQRTVVHYMGSSTLADAVAAVSEIAATLSSCYGPLPKEKLLVTATRRVLITSSGAAILASLVSAHPLARLVIDCATAHVQQVGDGGCAFVLLLHALLLEASRTLAALPLAQQAQQKAVTASALRELESSVLPRVLVPRWRAQARRTAADDDAELGRDARCLVATSLGSCFGAHASETRI